MKRGNGDKKPFIDVFLINTSILFRFFQQATHFSQKYGRILKLSALLTYFNVPLPQGLDLVGGLGEFSLILTGKTNARGLKAPSSLRGLHMQEFTTSVPGYLKEYATDSTHSPVVLRAMENPPYSCHSCYLPGNGRWWYCGTLPKCPWRIRFCMIYRLCHVARYIPFFFCPIYWWYIWLIIP